VSTANLANLVSTANLAGHISTANLANLVSTSYLNTSITSTVIGLGTAGYISSIPNIGGFVSTANLTNLVSTSFLNTSITSTVIGLGTAGYVSSSQLLSTSYGLYQKINSISTSSIAPSAYVAQGTLAVSQTISTGIDTQIGFVVSGSPSQVPTYDPQNWWNPITSTLVPTVAGYYLVNYQVWWNTPTTGGQAQQVNIQIHKTQTGIGPSISIAQNFFPSTPTTGTSQSLATMVQLNGTTEGIYFTAYNGNATNTLLRDGTYFNAMLILSGNANYTAGFISTPTLNNALTSTVIGLGTAGYLSSAITNLGGYGLVSTPNLVNLVSTANLSGHVSTANLTNLVSTANLANLVSTANLTNLVSTTFLNTALTSTIIGLGTAGYLSSALTNIGGYGLVSTANLTNLVSTTFLNTTITSTIIGLGTAGYLSSAVTNIGGYGLVSTANLTNLVSTANLTNLVSTANFTNLISTANLTNLVSTTFLNTAITSTIIGLGTAGYLSSAVTNIGGYGLVSTANLTNLVSTANLTNLVSTSYLNTALTSSIIGLGTIGYLSTAAFNASLTSTVIGLGTVGYISSQQLLSTTYGYSQNFLTLNASVSSLRFSTATGGNAYISSLTIDQLTFGDGNGWADFGALRAAVISTYQVNTGIVYAPIISTSLIVGVNFVTQANLTSTVIGLGTVGYLSAAITNLGGYGLVSTANLTNLISTANLANLVSTANLVNLVSTANLNNLISTANLANLVSTANLANLVSTSYLQTQLGSTVIGLGTVGYLSTQLSSFLTLSTGNLITSSITFNSPSSAPVGNNVFVSSSLFYFNQFVIGGTRVQQPQIFTF